MSPDEMEEILGRDPDVETVGSVVSQCGCDEVGYQLEFVEVDRRRMQAHVGLR
jgi:hypothetical protein